MVFLIILAVIIVIAIVLIALYNGLVQARLRVDKCLEPNRCAITKKI